MTVSLPGGLIVHFIDRVKPSIMVLFGGSGTGKRSFCELVAQELGITLVEMTASENATFDRYSEPLFGRIFEQGTPLCKS